MYTVRNIYHKLTITLTTNIKKTYTFRITFQIVSKSNAELYEGHIEDAPSTTQPFIQGVVEGDNVVFTIPLSNYHRGDVLHSFRVNIPGTKNLYNLDEGVVILVDGSQANVQQVINGRVQYKTGTDSPVLINTVKTPQFALNFDDNKVHTIQAVYKGNDGLGVSVSNPITVRAKQRPVEEPQDPSEPVPVIGDYEIKFLKVPTSFKYMQGLDIEVLLTKGGVPVSGKLVQLMFVDNVWSNTTNSSGKITIKAPYSAGVIAGFRRWKVRKEPYTFRAIFYHYDEPGAGGRTVTKDDRKVQMLKNDPILKFTPGGQRGKQAIFTLLYPELNNIPDSERGVANKKIVVKNGGNSWVLTTNELGQAKLWIFYLGRKQFKVSFAGDDNLNPINKTFEENITK